MTKLLTIFQNAGTLILEKTNAPLPFAAHQYNMRVENNSTFIDIGSGFGKPVFHAAM
jgi:16S rRNA G527 N7-methylase RsmG